MQCTGNSRKLLTYRVSQYFAMLSIQKYIALRNMCITLNAQKIEFAVVTEYRFEWKFNLQKNADLG